MIQDFKNERDRRQKFIIDKGLVPELCELVKRKNTPISSRTVKDTFKVEKFEDLQGTRLRVWIASGKLITCLEAEAQLYTKQD